MSVKRSIVRVKVKLRRRQRRREEKELRRLALERNKALHEADRAIRMAQAKENTLDAKAKRAKVMPQSRLKRQLAQSGNLVLSNLRSHTSSLIKDVRKGIGDAYKPKKRKKRAKSSK